MSATQVKARRREIRRAVGETATGMLSDVAEGMQQLGAALNAERERLNGFGKASYAHTQAVLALQDRAHALEVARLAFEGRTILGRLRWLLTGK